MKKKLLWIGDAVTQTGFARVTHCVLDYLRHKWDVAVLGINYDGDPHEYPYPIYPAMLGGDVWGIGRVQHIVAQFKPDVVLINNDPWNIPPYLEQLPPQVPVVAYMPVDAPNVRAARHLGPLARAIAYTHFGRKQLVLGGYTGRCDIIPHGVDTTIYKPMDKHDVRRELNLTAKIQDDAFVVGNVNRNQPRKRLDLTIQYWTQWWINNGQPRNAYLYLHCSNQDLGYDVLQLAHYYGMNTQLIITNPKMTTRNCLLEKNMPLVYNALDVLLSTTLGEGWGLTTHEAMACGIPPVLPRYSALGEWCEGAALFVPVTSFAATPSCINTIGGVPDMQGTVNALQDLYTSPERRAELSALALARATDPRYTWEAVAELFHASLLETVLERQQTPVGVEAPRS